MEEKKTFIVGWPETEEYDYENQPENIGTVEKLTDGDTLPYVPSGLDPGRNGGFDHKCTACGEGIMKEVWLRQLDERYECTNCGITLSFEKELTVRIW